MWSIIRVTIQEINSYWQKICREAGTQMLKIDITHPDRAALAAVEGEVDLYSSPQLRSTLLKLAAGKPPAIVVDLAGVTYMDSSGLATLIEVLQESGKYAGKFVLTSLRPEVRSVFELSRLDKVFEIYDNAEDALARLKQ